MILNNHHFSNEILFLTIIQYSYNTYAKNISLLNSEKIKNPLDF